MSDYQPFVVGAVVTVAVLVSLHVLDVLLDRRARQRANADRIARIARARADLAALHRTAPPPAPGTMRRRHSDLADTLPEDGDEGGRPVWRQEW
jgi:hypothetical protein